MLRATLLAVDGIKESVYHNVALIDAELGKKALNTVTSRTDENPADDIFRGSRILTDYKHPSRSIKPRAMSAFTAQPPAVENRTPLNTEIRFRMGFDIRIVAGKAKKRLGNRARVERVYHNLTVFLMRSAIKGR